MKFLTLNLILIIIEWIIIKSSGIKKPRKTFCIVAFIQLFVFHAFLDPDKMYDLPGYLETYDSFSENPLMYSLVTGYVGVKMEPGWIVLCKLLSYLSKNSLTIIFFSSIIIVGSYCKTVYKYSPMVWLSIFIFLCTTYGQSLFVLRQHTAIALCLASIPFILNRDLFKFALAISLASSLHLTAIVFFPMYFIYSIELNNSFYLKVLVLTIIGYTLSATVFMWFFSNSWYDSYIDGEGSNLTNFAIMGIVLLFYLFTIKWKIRDLQGPEKCFFLMCVLGVVLSLAGTGFSPTNRLIKYYYVSMLFLLPYGLMKISNTFARVLSTIAIMLAFLMLFYSSGNTEYLKDYTLFFNF